MRVCIWTGSIVLETADPALPIGQVAPYRGGEVLGRCDHRHRNGAPFAPQAFQIGSAARVTGEVFGPILHVVRWHADRLDAVIDEIAVTGYGLTLGIRSNGETDGLFGAISRR